MKKIILLIALVSLFFLSACGKKNENIENNNGSSDTSQDMVDPSVAKLSFDEFSFSTMTLEGEKVSSEEVFSKSKVTMVNVWGTFCPPCIHEMPDLAKLHGEYNHEDFQILGLIVDTSVTSATNVEDAEAIVKDAGVGYTNILVSPSLEGYLSNFQAVPTTFFVNSQGKVVGKAYRGAKPYDNWKSIIDEVIAENK